MRRLSVLLVDDNPQFMKTARDVVAASAHAASVACVNSGNEALALIVSLARRRHLESIG
jgi:CheY-like chemotaxis protein